MMNRGDCNFPARPYLKIKKNLRLTTSIHFTQFSAQGETNFSKSELPPIFACVLPTSLAEMKTQNCLIGDLSKIEHGNRNLSNASSNKFCVSIKIKMVQ